MSGTLTFYFVGTSMATPFIAGFASYVGSYLRTTNPDDIKTAINNASSKNVIKNSKSENNNLPYDTLSEKNHLADMYKFLTENR